MSLSEWLTNSTSPSNWHLLLIWIMIAVCMGWEVAIGEPLLHAVFGG